MKHNKTKPELTVLFKYPIYNINCSYFSLLTKCIRRSIRNTDSGFSCSWFYRFRLFMFLVLQIPAFHVPGFLVPCSVPRFPVPCFTDSLCCIALFVQDSVAQQNVRDITAEIDAAVKHLSKPNIKYNPFCQTSRPA